MELHNAVKKHGSINAAARFLEIAPTTFRRRLDKERRDSISSFMMPEPIRWDIGENGSSFIITSAQDKTHIHVDFWNNLKAYATYLGAEILVGGFTYSKRLFAENDPRVRSQDVWFDEEIEPYIIHDKVELGDNLVFCAEMNTLPTATQPLSGLETYTKERWGIFPHAKIQLRSIANMKQDRSKQIMTTGAVTLPNYVRKKAGVKAEFHHQIAAVLVTVDADGAFFCRHIQATSFDDGSFYDLDRHVSGGIVSTGHRVEAIVHGDIHVEKIDEEVAKSTWGLDLSKKYVPPRAVGKSTAQVTLMAQLNPKYRVFHDLMDFSARNHHSIGDHHFRFHAFHHGCDSVKDDVTRSAGFLAAIASPDTTDIVVQSNHDNALLKWLKHSDARFDPVNYEFWLECELKYVKALKENKKLFLFEAVIRDIFELDHVQFVSEDSSYKICDIETAIHGHYGANGAKGSGAAFAKMGPKSITAHSHTPSITDGNMTVGTNSKLDMGYNKGLSSWSHTNAIIYPNGQRTLITMMSSRWF